MSGLHVRPSRGAPFPLILSSKKGPKIRSEKETLHWSACDDSGGGPLREQERVTGTTPPHPQSLEHSKRATHSGGYIYIYIYIYILDSHMAPYGACEVVQS